MKGEINMKRYKMKTLFFISIILIVQLLKLLFLYLITKLFDKVVHKINL